MDCKNPIAAALARKGLSRVKLAESLGVSRRTVGYWEAWDKIPSPENVAAIKALLDLTDTEVLRMTHPPKRKTVSIPQVRRGSIW